MKFKKLTTISISIFLIGLIVATNSNALTTHTVEYPTHVKLGETFTANLVFNYDLECNCLYGLTVWFYWMVNDEITSSWTSGLTKNIYSLENYPRISNVSWTLDTSIMYGGNLETDDVIQFKFMYKTGYDTGYVVEFEGYARTTTYEITIGEVTTEKTNNANFTVPVLILSAALIFTKRKKRVELK